MYYVPEQSLLGSSSNTTQITLLINILSTIPNQRSLQDHQFIFKFFHNNKILCDVQRLKSLNAKQQCIVNLTIDTIKPIYQKQLSNDQSKQKQKQKIIVDRIVMEQVVINKKGKQEIIQTKYYVLLDAQIKQQIMKADQRYLRKNIQILKKYMILKDLKYGQLLHLAYYMDQITYKYKQIVYHQGDNPDYLYLAEKGQFHYAKLLKNDSNIKHNRDKKKDKDKPKRYQFKTDNPNRSKGSVSVQMKIGVIQGDCGQSFGQQQIVTQKMREYSVKCMSTQNLVMRVPNQNYKRILSSTTITRMQWMKKDNLNKIKLKHQMLNKMIEVKKNYHKYAEIIQKNNISKTEGLRFDLNGDGVNHATLSNSNLNKNMLPKIKSHSVASSEHYQLQNAYRSVDRSRIILEDQQQNKNLKNLRKSVQSQSNEDGNTFALTNNKAEIRRSRKVYLQTQQQSIGSHLPTSGSNQGILPSIQSQKSQVSKHQGGDQIKGKNWSSSRPLVQLRGLRHKFSGMIFANSLIKEKEEILNSKLIGKDASRDIFPMDLSEKKPHKPVIGILTKQQAREMRSAVHSKLFMQKLLVQALKKAGYNSQKNSQNYAQDNPDAVVDIKNNLRIPKPKVKIQKQDSLQLLTDNSFDEYYFKKMN